MLNKDRLLVLNRVRVLCILLARNDLSELDKAVAIVRLRIVVEGALVCYLDIVEVELLIACF